MKLELKNLRHNAALSDETACFSADLYVDGVKAAAISNRGQGGCHEMHAYGAKGQALLDQAEAYAKTLPPHETSMEGVPPLDMDLELWIACEVEEIANRKDFERKCKTKTLYYESAADKKAGRYIICDEAYSAPLKAEILAEHPQAEIINESVCGQKPAAERAISNYLLRQLKKTVIYAPNGDMKDLKQHKTHYSGTLAAQLRAKYPNVLILNEKYGVFA